VAKKKIICHQVIALARKQKHLDDSQVNNIDTFEMLKKFNLKY
jgi:hypothetical protein